MSAGTVELVCERRDARNVLARVRTDGLARASRLPAGPDGAVHVMLATLGPGLLGGDAFTTRGRVSHDAALLVSAQMATPVFPGAGATLASTWEIDDGATLCAIGQPLVPLPGSALTAVAELDVSGSGCAVVAETLAGGAGAGVRNRTLGRIDGRLVLRDALVLPAATGDGAVGSVYALAGDAALRARWTEAAWSLLDADATVRGGAGGTDGAVVVRVIGAPFATQRATARIAERLARISRGARP